MNTETTHTIVVLDDGETWGGDGTLQVITDEQHDALCEGKEPDDFNPIAYYNIAALSDLLEVARDYLLLCDLHDWEGHVADTARAAIAKATGGDA